MKTKSTTEVISNFLSQKDPLTELNKVHTILDVLRDDLHKAKDDVSELNISEIYNMVNDCAEDLSKVVEFMSAMQAEVLQDLQYENIGVDFMQVH